MRKELRECLQPLYFEAGATLAAAQILEYGLKLLIFLLSHQRRISMDFAAAERILDGDAKKTLGQLFRALSDEGVLSATARVSVEAAVEPRNRFVHSFLVDNAERVVDEEKRSALIREIRAVRSQLQKADAHVREMVGILLSRYGLSFDEITKSMESKMAESLRGAAASTTPLPDGAA